MFILGFLALLWRYSKLKTAIVFLLTLVSALTEGIGLILLIPLLAVVQNVENLGNGISSKVIEFIETLGIPITIEGIIATFLLLILFRSIFDFMSAVISQKIQLELMDDLRCQTFEALLFSNWKWLSSLRRSDHSSILLNEINRVSTGLTVSVRLSVGVVRICIYLFVAAALSINMTLIAIVVGGFASFLLRKQHKDASQLGANLTGKYAKMHMVVEEGLSGIKLTKILGNEERHRNLMKDILRGLREQKIAFSKTNALAGSVFQILIALFLAGFLLVGLQVLELPAQTLMVFVLILARAAPMLRKLQSDTNQVLHAAPALKNVISTLSLASLNRDTGSSIDGLAAVSLSETMDFTNVSFSYEGQEQRSLSTISLSIPARKTTAIMGASGSGKSTLADVLMGLLVPVSGSISIDGVPLTDENRQAWRNSIAYVPQEVFLFHDSIRNNLLWANLQASEEQLNQALAKASAQFVFDLTDGLDTIVGDAGLRLSGGERQRIALARAMLRQPTLLILDEATSALDLENEFRIRDSIDALHGDLTVVVIGHRLPTLENADQVIVLKDGRVEKSGTWAEISI